MPSVTDLHQPVRYFHVGDEGTWFETADEAAAEYGDCLADVMYTDVCEHCATLETSQGGDHQESLWPCSTAKALGL